MILPHIVVINVHNDPAQHYFEVTAELLSGLNIQPSDSSYLSPDSKYYFLECDKDAERFLHALDEHNIDFRFEEIKYDRPAFFRQYKSAVVLH